MLHPPPLPFAPSFPCCSHSKVTSNHMPVCKYKSLHDFHFYQLFYLKSSSSPGSDFLLNQCTERSQDKEGEVQKGWKGQPDPAILLLQQKLKCHDSTLSGLDLSKAPSKLPETDGPSRSIFGADQAFPDVPDVSAPSRTCDLLPPTAQSCCGDTPRADSVKSARGGSGRTPAVKPLPFSVEALLRAWQASGEGCEGCVWTEDWECNYMCNTDVYYLLSWQGLFFLKNNFKSMIYISYVKNMYFSILWTFKYY